MAYAAVTTEYDYDAAYNRIAEQTTDNASSTVTIDKTYQYNNRNQITQATDNLDASHSATYAFDNNGNRISRTEGTLVSTFIYDARDQLKEITSGGSSIGQFLYDYQGLRIRKQTNSETLRYVYDDQSVLIQTDDSGTTLSKYDYGPDRLLSLNNTTEGSQFYLFDALGSVVNLTKPDTSIQTRIQYDAWGNVRNQVGSNKNEFGFTGHEMDEESGLIYMKARFYDPVLGTFLNQDSFEGTSDTPPSLHKYLYAYGNPVVYWDPDGNAAFLASGKEFDELGYQLYQDGNRVGAAGVAVLGAAYKFGTGFFSFGLFDEANQAITDTDTYGGAAKQFGSSVANTAKEVAQEYVEEGVVAGTATVAGKLACGRFKQACGAVVDTAKKIGDKLNTDIKVTKESSGGPGAQLTNSKKLDAGANGGTAEVQVHEIPGQRQPHISVEVTHKNNKLQTDQRIVDENKNTTMFETQKGDLKDPVDSVEVELPDAKAAQDFQKANIGKNTGVYNPKTNNCLTQACEVLRAGGLDAPKNSKDARRYLQELKKQQ